MRKPLLKRAFFIWMVAGMLAAGSVGIAAAQAPGKQITVSEREPELSLQFESTKPAYKVNEPISFKVKTNKAAYVYLIQVNDTSQTAVMLYPNKYETFNRTAAGRQLVLPPRKSVFKSDRPGVEHVVLLASTGQLDLQTGKTIGEAFLSVEKSALDSLVKEIRVESRRNGQRAVKQLDLLIKGKAGANPARSEAPPNSGKPMVLVSTDKIAYGVNETMTIAYASDADGYLRLYVVNPEKKVTLLKTEKVQKSKIYREKGVAEQPTGSHLIVAVYSDKDEKGEAEVPLVKALSGGEQGSKDVSLLKGPDIFAIYTFTIQ